MNDNNSFHNVGNQIRDALTDALQNGNFQTLNDLVSQTVTATLEEVGVHITPGSSQASRRQNGSSSFGQAGGQQNSGSSFGQTGGQQNSGSSFGQAGGQQNSGSSFGQAGRQQNASGSSGQAYGQQNSSGQAGGQTSDIPLWQQALGPDLRGGANAQGRTRTGSAYGQQNRSGSSRTYGQQNSFGSSDRTYGQQNSSGSSDRTYGQQNTSGSSDRAYGQQNAFDWQQQEQLRRQQSVAEQQRLRQERQQRAAAERQRQQREQQLKREQQQFQYQRQAEELRHQEQLRRHQTELEQQKLRQERQRQAILERHHRRQERQMTQMQVGYTPDGRPNLELVRIRQVGRVSGILFTVFGGIGAGFFFLLFLTGLFMLSAEEIFAQATFLGLGIFFGGMLATGIYQRRRLRRAKRYVSLCDPRMFGQVADFARLTGKSETYVANDLRRILNAGIFPEGHLDEQRTCFMLNDVVFRQYLEAENSRRLREEAKRPTSGPDASAQGGGADDTASDSQAAELNVIAGEGMTYISRLHELNDQIPGEVISAKLFRLEHLLKDIFDNIREHPDQIHRIHKLMEYYLPTTLKLVEAYADFDQVSVPGDEIIKAKAEIENTLDTINQAFTELLNNLFQDAVFDATTDAQVLKTMLAKEGLTKDMDVTTYRQQGGKSDEQ